MVKDDDDYHDDDDNDNDDDDDEEYENLISLRQSRIFISCSGSFNDGERRHNQHYDWDVLPIPE